MAGKDTIAVLGAGGTMGFPMARNLAHEGFEVRAWNRSSEKAEPLRDDGATVADSPRSAVEGADVLLTMLADAETVLETVAQALPTDDGERRELLWCQMSTIGERAAERCAKLAEERGVSFIDAPVLGTKQPAEKGELVVLASGPEQARDRLAPIFETLGKRTMWLGEAGNGSRLKVATNSWILAVVEGGAETLALAEGMGIDPQQVLDAVAGGPLDLPYLQMKGEAILQRDFDPSFRLALAAKDAALAQESAELHGLDLPLLRTIRERLQQAVPEHGDEDLAATYLTSAPR